MSKADQTSALRPYKVKKMKARLLTGAILALLGACGGEPPTLERVDPGLICDEQGGATLRLQGSALEPAVQQALEDEPSLLLPTVHFEPAGGLTEGSAATSERSVEVEPSRLSWTAPDSVEIRVDGGLGLEPGSWDVVVDTRTGHQARMPAGLSVAPPPALTSVDPARACHETDSVELNVQGSGFLWLGSEGGGSGPIVTVGAAEAVVVAAQGCEHLTGPVEGQVCSGLTLSLDPASLPLGDAQLALINPEPAGCSAQRPLTVEVVLPPTIDDVIPAVVCTSGGTVQVTGGPFIQGTTASLEGVTVSSTTVIDSGLIELVLEPDAPVGSATLALTDPSGCTASLADAVQLVSPPQAFHIDPPVAPSGRAIGARAQLADVNADITQAWLVHASSGEERSLDWSWSEDEPSELHFELPADLDTGRWLLGIEQAEGCPGPLSAGIELVSEATVALDSVDPPHAWTFDHTALLIEARDPIPAGQQGFEDVPGVYLLGPAGQDIAAPLLGVRYRDQLQLTAVVPPGLEPGLYDLMVVNPDGAHGLLGEALEVTWDAPPVIDTVSPATLEKSRDQTLEIHGADFRDPTLGLICLEDGVTSELSAVVEQYSYGSIQASVSTRGYNQALCVVQVTNDDGTTASWSAISITNPAQNLFPFELGSPMLEARRAPAAAAGRTTSMDRYVYAIGGDQGDAASALASAELATVDPYGELGDWSWLTLELPSPRTLAASATVGRFVYLAGGDDGSGAVDTILRAQVLDPLEVPWLDGVSVSTVDRGLEAGRWTYRVSALFDESDPSNPGGESLAGEPISLTLPDTDSAWAPTLCWEGVDRAVGYRVYRSPTPDAPSNELGWLADNDSSLCHQDQGGSVDTSTAPLPDGSLGAWATVATLATARSAPCLALAQDPALDPEIFHLYVAGGRDPSGALLDSIEVVDVTVVSDDEHGVGEPWLLSQRLSEPRWQCAGYTVDDSLHSVVADESWIFFAGGMAEHNASGVVDRGRVTSDGEVDSWGTTRSLTPARAGFAHASASDFLYAFGGQQGQASSSGASAEIRDEGQLDLHNWNSLGASMHLARLLPGSAQESAIIFVLGGQTDSSDASTSTEYTHY